MKSYYSIIDHIPLPSFLIPFFKRQNSPVITWEILFCLLDLSAKSCYIKNQGIEANLAHLEECLLTLSQW